MKQIFLTRAKIGKEETSAVTRMLKSGWLTMGEETERFEREFTRYVGSNMRLQ